MPLKLFQEIKYVLIVKGFFHGCVHARRLIYRKHEASDIKKRVQFWIENDGTDEHSVLGGDYFSCYRFKARRILAELLFLISLVM